MNPIYAVAKLRDAARDRRDIPAELHLRGTHGVIISDAQQPERAAKAAAELAEARSVLSRISGLELVELLLQEQGGGLVKLL